MKLHKLLLISLICTPLSTLAGQYTAAKNKACPEGWEDTWEIIPVIANSTESPWGTVSEAEINKALGESPSSTELWIADTEIILAKTSDMSDALNQLSSSNPVETLDELPVSDFSLVNDPLTVASECLVYRNLEVDVANYVAPEPTEPNYDAGWIPAVLF